MRKVGDGMDQADQPGTVTATRTAPATADGEAPPTPRLAVRGLVKSYGSTLAVAGVSLTVPAGRVVGLLGANGAGKTTTIGCVAGLLPRDRGEVRICGVDPATDPGRTGPLLGLAGQDLALYPELPASTNLRFFAELAGMTRADADASVDELAGALGIGPLLARRVRDLSGGQKQLVHVAAALVHRPRLALLDEPSAGLDLTARSRFLDTVRRTAAAGAGVLLSSHHLADVEQVCDDVVILHRGRAVAAGPLDELIAAYAEPFVEVSAGGRRRRVPGTDVLSALAGLGDLRDLESVAVRRPSLEAVFVAVTGTRPEPGEEAR